MKLILDGGLQPLRTLLGITFCRDQGFQVHGCLTLQHPPRIRPSGSHHEVQPAETDARGGTYSTTFGWHRVVVVESVVLACGRSTCRRAWMLRTFVVVLFVWKITVAPMNFSIRDLLLVTALAAVVMGWWIDRGRLATENYELRAKLASSHPLPGSKEAMAAFLSVVKSGSSVEVNAAAKRGFVPGNSASPYLSLLAKADRTCAPDSRRFPNGVQYEFWCQSRDPKYLSGSYVCITATGDPLKIVEAELVVTSPPEEAAP